MHGQIGNGKGKKGVDPFFKRIHDECVSAEVKVEFRRLKTGFVVVFYRPKWEEGEGIKKGVQTGGQRKGVLLSDKQKKILEILKKKPQISRKELAEDLGINTSAVQKHLDIKRVTELLS